MAELNDLIYHFSNDGSNINVEIRPLVKCKECKKWFATQNNENGDITKVFCVNGVHEPDWFCADGERRDPCSSQDS